MSKPTLNNEPVTIKLPGNEYPYNQCLVEEGDVGDLTRKLVFTTISKAGIRRRVTIHPNGTVVEQKLEDPT